MYVFRGRDVTPHDGVFIDVGHIRSQFVQTLICDLIPDVIPSFGTAVSQIIRCVTGYQTGMLADRRLGGIVQSRVAAVESRIAQFTLANGVIMGDQLLVGVIAEEVDKGFGQIRVFFSGLKLRGFRQGQVNMKKTGFLPLPIIDACCKI